MATTDPHQIQKPRPIKPMDSTEFEVIRLTLGEDGRPYPTAWLAIALGYSTRAVYNWLDENLNEGVPLPVAKLMRKWNAQGYVD